MTIIKDPCFIRCQLALPFTNSGFNIRHKLFKFGSPISLANYMQKCSLALGHFYFNLFSIIWYQKFLQTDSHKFWIQLYTSRYFYSNENSTALGFQFLYWYGGSFFFVRCILQNDWHGPACCLELIISNSVLEPNGSSSQSLSQCT